MLGGTVRADLVRAYESFFGLKGGQGPTVAPEAIGVVILDDNSGGPYPGYRSFLAGRAQGAAAAALTAIGIQNIDATGSRSVAVIDKIIWRTGAADDILVAIVKLPTIVLINLLTPTDTAQDKEQQPVDNPQIGNVLTGTLTQAAALSGETIAGGDALQHTLDGPFTLGPQEQLVVQTKLVNEALFCAFRGRYYPTP